MWFRFRTVYNRYILECFVLRTENEAQISSKVFVVWGFMLKFYPRTANSHTHHFGVG